MTRRSESSSRRPHSSHSLLLLLLMSRRWLLLLLMCLRLSSIDQKLYDPRLIAQHSMMQGVIPLFVDFRWVGTVFEQHLHDAQMSMAASHVHRRLAVHFKVNERVEVKRLRGSRF